MVFLSVENFNDFYSLEDYLVKEKFTNLSLSVVENGIKFQIRCHRLVLASSSGFLKRVLNGDRDDEDSDSEIILSGASYADARALLKFLYTGVVNFESRELYEGFASLLQALDIKLLVPPLDGKKEEISPSLQFQNGLKEREELRWTNELWVLKEQRNSESLTTVDDSAILYEFSPPIKDNGLLLSFELENIDPIPFAEEERRSPVLPPPHPTERLHSCADCRKTFPSKTYLKFHRNSVHSKGKDYKCSLCFKVFSGSYYLRQHSKRMHSEDGRIFRCQSCPSSFGVKYDLVVHERNHEPVKRYRCQVCDKTYSNGRALKEHSRTHTGERPYECNVCNKKFALPKTLRVHYRQHSGERPYLCPQCGMTFVQNSTLKSHLKTNHGGG